MSQLDISTAKLIISPLQCSKKKNYINWRALVLKWRRAVLPYSTIFFFTDISICTHISSGRILNSWKANLLKSWNLFFLGMLFSIASAFLFVSVAIASSFDKVLWNQNALETIFFYHAFEWKHTPSNKIIGTVFIVNPWIFWNKDEMLS